MSTEYVVCSKTNNAMLVDPTGNAQGMENQRSVLKAGLNAFCKNNCSSHCLAQTMTMSSIGHEVKNIINGAVSRIVGS